MALVLKSPSSPAAASIASASAEDLENAEFYIYAADKHLPFSKEYLQRLMENDPTLVELDLHKKFITDVSVAGLTDALMLNTVLTSLNSGQNFITSVGCFSIAKMIERNTTLCQLNLEYNDIDEGGIQVLLEALHKNDTLNLISVDGNEKLQPELVKQLYLIVRLNSQSPAVKQIIADLSDSSKQNLLRIIDLSCEDAKSKYFVDDFCATILATVLRTNRFVQVLRLRGNRIGDDGATQLALMLEDNCSLDEIDLFSNVVGAVGANAFIEALTHHNNTLQQLNLCSNNVSDNILVEVEWALALNRQPLNLKRFVLRLRDNDCTLTELFLDEHESQRYFDDTSARIISDALLKNCHLSSLEIPNSHIAEVGAHFFADLLLVNTTLVLLNLENNRISEGASWFVKSLKVNSTLTMLNLSNNDVPDAIGFEAAEMIKMNNGLIELNLRNNHLKKCGGVLSKALNSNSTLQQLLVEGNDIPDMFLRDIQQGCLLNKEPKALRQILPEIYNANPPLTELNLDYSEDSADKPLTDTSAFILSSALREHYHIKELSLADNDIGINGIRNLCQMLTLNNHTLTSLNLSRNKDLGPELVEELVHVLHIHDGLTSLDISYNYIGEEGARLMLDFLKANTKIKYLNIEGCRCSKPTFKAIEIFTAANRSCVGLKWQLANYLDGKYDSSHKIDFSSYTKNDSFNEKDEDRYIEGIPVPDYTVEVVTRLLEGNNTMNSFCFCDNLVGDIGCAILADFFSRNCRITHLDLSKNFISDSGVQSLIQFVKRRSEILEISLHGNDDTSTESIDSLQYFLQYNHLPPLVKEALVNVESGDPNYHTVDLSELKQGHVTDNAVNFLSESLKENTTVKTLDLSNNHITAVGLTKLCQMLENNTTITSFSINNNGLHGLECGKVLQSVLLKNSTLQKLSLRSNELSEEVGKMLLSALASNHTVIKLNAMDNAEIPDDLVTKINEATHVNTFPEFKQMLPLLSGNALTSLNLSKQCDLRCLNVLALYLESNTTLTEVDLSFNNLTSVKEFSELVISKHPRLLRINLERNRLNDEACKPLALGIQRNVTGSLYSINLRHNAITDIGVKGFSEAMKMNNTVVELLFEGNKVDKVVLNGVVPEMCLNMQPLLKKSLPLIRKEALENLNFSEGQEVLVPSQTEPIELTKQVQFTHYDLTCKLLSAELYHNQTLRKLNLSNGQVSDRGVAFICNMLIANRSLEELSLANQQPPLTVHSAVALSDVLVVCTSLAHINLAKNAITDEGAQAAISSLELNHTCKTFNLDGNPLSSEVHKQLNDSVLLNRQPDYFKLFVKNKKAILLEEYAAQVENRVVQEEGTSVKPVTLRLVGTQAEKYDELSAQLISDFLKLVDDVTSVDLSHNSITDEGGIILTELLKQNSTLTSLTLEYNNLTDGVIWIEMAKRNSTLTSLKLEHTNIPAGFVDKANSVIAFNNHPQLLKEQVLKLLSGDGDVNTFCANCLLPDHLNAVNQFPFADNRVAIRDSACKLIANQLRGNIHVKDINLAYNRIGDEGVSILVQDFISTKQHMVTALDLSHNWINDAGASVLAKGLSDSEMPIIKLKLDHNSISDQAAPDLIHMMKVNIRIEQLSVTDNFLSFENVKVLELLASVNRKNITLKTCVVEALNNNPKVTTFDISGLPEWEDEILTLAAEAIIRSKTTTKFTASCNNLSSGALAPIAEIISKGTSVQEIILSNNSITSTEKFAFALKGNTSLRSLNLSYNQIGADELWDFCKYIRENGCLQQLDLSGNCFGRVGCRHLIEALKYNSSITTLNLTGMNDIDNEMLEEAQVSLKLFYGDQQSNPAQPNLA